MNEEKEKMVGVVLPAELIQKLQEEADKKERSLSAQVRFILKKWLGKEEGK